MAEWVDEESLTKFRLSTTERLNRLSAKLQIGGADRPSARNVLCRFIPIFWWLPNYKWRDSFLADLSSGLTMAVFSVPTGIAHAGICGVAPVYGLYTAIFPTLFYVLFGNSKYNALGGFAILSLMTSSAIEKVYRSRGVVRGPAPTPSPWGANSSSFTQRQQPPYSPFINGSLTALTQLNNDTDFDSLDIEGIVDFARENGTVMANDSIATTPQLLEDDPILSILDPQAKWDDEGKTATEVEGGGQPMIRVVHAAGPPLDVRPIHIATAIVFLSGILQTIFFTMRLDFLSCYLSEQVMSGFVVGGSVHVFFAQIGDLLGIQLPARSGRGYLYRRLIDLANNLHEVQFSTSIISACSISFLLFSQRVLEPWLASAFDSPIPYEFLLVVIGITATNFGDLSFSFPWPPRFMSLLFLTSHVAGQTGTRSQSWGSCPQRGYVDFSFPAPSLPRVDLAPMIFFDALGITITAVAIHLTVVKIVENKYQHRINSCQELYSLGFAGLFSSMFPVFPVTSIFARTVIGNADKNSTQMTSFFSCVALLAVILYIGPALEYLPKCVLASIVVVSLSASMAKLGELRRLWPLFKFDFVIFIVSFTLTVCNDMAEGLMLTVVFAIFTIVIRDQWPKWHFLSHDKELNEYKETPKELLHIVDTNACVLRYDAPLIFTNVHKFVKVVGQGIKRWERRETAGVNDPTKEGTRYKWRFPSPVNGSVQVNGTSSSSPTSLIIDCSGFPYVDWLGLCTLKRVYKDYAELGISVKFAAPKAVLMRMFKESDFAQVVREENIFATVR